MSVDLHQVKNKAVARLLTKYPVLLDQWAKNARTLTFSDTPWSPLAAEINQCRLALITTGGVRLKSQPTFDMRDSAGDPTFREIPDNVSLTELAISHNYYDGRDAEKDINIMLPIQRAAELKQGGEIKTVNHRHFSFMGHIKEHHIVTLMEKTAPEVAAALKKDRVDIAILTPG